MSQIRVHPAVVATLVAAVLATAPALAAPPRSAGPGSGALADLAGGWADVTAPFLSVVSADPTGSDAVTLKARTTGDRPDADPEHRLTVDPDG